jgi:hypothetical protein
MSIVVTWGLFVLAIVTIIAGGLSIYFHFAVIVPSLQDTERDLGVSRPDLHRMYTYLVAIEAAAVLLSIGVVWLVLSR